MKLLRSLRGATRTPRRSWFQVPQSRLNSEFWSVSADMTQNKTWHPLIPWLTWFRPDSGSSRIPCLTWSGPDSNSTVYYIISH